MNKLNGFIDTANPVDLSAISLAQNMEHVRHPEHDKTLVELFDDKVVILEPGHIPNRIPIEAFRKIMPDLLKRLLKGQL